MARQSQRQGFAGYFEWFVHSQVAGSVLLLLCAVIALVWANSPWRESYENLLHLKAGFTWGEISFKLTLHHWINDGLMVLFFFVVGLEVKRELLVGQLSTFDRAMLPVAAAVGGMLVPAGMYAIVNAGGPGAPGWGVPMATDIAFALGVLALFGSRAPVGLKVFLTALAIADDIGAVFVIAVFYTESIRPLPLILAGLMLAGLYVLIRAGLKRVALLQMIVVAVWLAVYASGVHATVAGILVAMVIPVRPRLGLEEFVRVSRQQVDRIEQMEISHDSIIHDQEQLDAVETTHMMAEKSLPTGLLMEHYLHPIQVWLILPLFALANAGVHLDSHFLEILTNPISLGIVAGLVLGKPFGVVLLTWVVVHVGGGRLPEGVNWRQVVGAGCLAGIGFTMSLFVTELAFPSAELVAQSKVGILVASLLSGIAGYVLLSRSLPAQEPAAQ